MASSKKKKKRNPASKGPAKNGSSPPHMSKGAAAKHERRQAAERQSELKRKGSWAVLFVGVAVIVSIIGLSIKSSIDSSTAGVAERDGWELPSLYDGEDVTLASLRGKPVVLNFFASWCTACEAELPEFSAAVEEFGDQVEFVFIDSQDSDGLGREMAERHGIDEFTVVKDFGASNSALFRELGGRGMPITAFYDAQGNWQFTSSGALVNGALIDALTQLGFI